MKRCILWHCPGRLLLLVSVKCNDYVYINRVTKTAWDVLSGAVKMAWDVLSGVTKTAWDVLSGMANRCGRFCSGCQKMAWDVLSRDVLSYIHK